MTAPQTTPLALPRGVCAPQKPTFPWKLWLYTNYDCNIRCSYCVARSGPDVPRRALGAETVRRLVDEAVALGFRDIYFTGGEPFLLPDIFDMLAYSAARVRTTVLTNAMLLRGRRLERLTAIAGDNLIVQVSLDGARPEEHDPYRGAGTWRKTMDGLHNLLERGFRVRLSTTETPANSARMDDLCRLHTELGIAEADHIIRPLAKRGFATEGMEVRADSIVPEVTVDVDGVYWHPLSTDTDMRISRTIFPLREPVERIRRQLDALAERPGSPLITFT
ncbi:MAG: radical SAM protein [Caldilineae bacterium]|nr:MAG: radical SAM protein [Caldilineae bacterium]